MLEEREVPKRGKWIALTVLILVLVYVITDGWLINKIEPQTVVAVYEPGGIRALVNKTDNSARMWKWPRILGTSIGVREEPIKDEAKVITTRFAMYTTDEITGEAEDKDYVQAYVVDTEIKVKDWEKFFQEINLDEINKERRKAGPFGVFWGILPTFGFAILFSVPTAFLLRANRLSAIVGTFISNPLTWPFIYPLGWKIGQQILGLPPADFSEGFFRVQNLLGLGKSLIVGSLVGNSLLATPISLVSYLVVLMAVARYRRRHSSGSAGS